MTQERLDEIKREAEFFSYADKSSVTELISALEESREELRATQKVESLIVQIFEAGGDLSDLVGFNYKEENPYYRLLDQNNVMSREQYNLVSALEFILERTK